MLMMMIRILCDHHPHLGQCHLCYNRQHDLLSFSRVGILFVFIQPSFQCGGGLSRRILPPRSQVIASSIPAIHAN